MTSAHSDVKYGFVRRYNDVFEPVFKVVQYRTLYVKDTETSSSLIKESLYMWLTAMKDLCSCIDPPHRKSFLPVAVKTFLLSTD